MIGTLGALSAGLRPHRPPLKKRKVEHSCSVDFISMHSQPHLRLSALFQIRSRRRNIRRGQLRSLLPFSRRGPTDNHFTACWPSAFNSARSTHRHREQDRVEVQWSVPPQPPVRRRTATRARWTDGQHGRQPGLVRQAGIRSDPRVCACRDDGGISVRSRGQQRFSRAFGRRTLCAREIQPGEINFASANSRTGQHLSAELFKPQ